MTTASEWIGRVGQAWATEWQRTDRAFAPLTRQLLAELDIEMPPQSRAFDIGCGAGEIAITLAEMRPNLSVIGVDVSDELVATARKRAGNVPNLAFIVGDAPASAATQAPIDLFLSRHGVMFFDDPVAAFTAFRAAAAPGARLVFTCFRDWSLNRFASDIGAILGEGPPSPDLPGPFAFADAERVRALLARAGWSDIAAEPIDFLFRAGEGADPVADAVSFLTQIGPAARVLRDVPEARRPDLLEALRRCCQDRLIGGEVDFPAAAWLWTATNPAKGLP